LGKEMAGSKKENEQANLKISELILSARSLSYQIQRLRKERFLSEKVIDLTEYRKLRKTRQVKAVLVIDDDEEMKEPFSKALEKKGYQALFGGDLESLAKIIESHSFDLVLMNPGLNWLDGFEFCRLMKGNQFLRDLPIIFISREAPQKEIRKAFESGCDDYVSKPIKLERLVRTIKYFLENY